MFLISFDDEGVEVLVGAASTEEEIAQVIAHREQQRLVDVVRRDGIFPDSPEYDRLLRELKKRLGRYHFARV